MSTNAIHIHRFDGFDATRGVIVTKQVPPINVPFPPGLGARFLPGHQDASPRNARFRGKTAVGGGADFTWWVKSLRFEQVDKFSSINGYTHRFSLRRDDTFLVDDGTGSRTGRGVPTYLAATFTKGAGTTLEVRTLIACRLHCGPWVEPGDLNVPEAHVNTPETIVTWARQNFGAIYELWERDERYQRISPSENVPSDWDL
jgi:hypothetical protein